MLLVRESTNSGLLFDLAKFDLEIKDLTDKSEHENFWGNSSEALKVISRLNYCKNIVETPSQGRWDPDSLRQALSLGGQATAWEGSPGRSLCLTKSSACGRLWQFAQPRQIGRASCRERVSVAV